jgi:hypothetical protein
MRWVGGTECLIVITSVRTSGFIKCKFLFFCNLGYQNLYRQKLEIEIEKIEIVFIILFSSLIFCY